MSALPTAARASLERAGRTRAAALARRHALVAGLVAVVLVGGWLRLDGANWDDGGHLHPDERYLSIVADSVAWPDSVAGYFDVEHSPLSPYNTEQGRAYVYGTLPLFATMAVGAAVGQDEYGNLHLVGRRLAALVDTASIVLVFFLSLLVLEGLGRARARIGALVAAALYAFTVTAIQHSHFFTTDTWLTAFGLLTFYVAARSMRSGVEAGSARFAPIFLLVGACLGLTAACKIAGGLVVIPVLLALLGRTALTAAAAGYREALGRLGLAGLTVLVSAYAAFRVASPYTFAHSSWLDVSLNADFRGVLEAQRQATNGEFLYPPSYQWLLTPRLWGPLENLVVWQLGVALGLAALGGLALLLVRTSRAGVRLARRRERLVEVAAWTVPAMLVAFVLVVFFYMGSRFAHSGRYLVPIAPFLCVAAAYGLVGLAGIRRLLLVSAGIVVAATAFYAVAFHHIYTEPNTRMAASDWIVANVPPGSTIVNEHWDDSLPVGGGAAGYKGLVLPVFDADDGDKLRKLYDGLAHADYYILSSPRAWLTIGRLPDRFPLMARFYEELFAGRLGYGGAASFTSEPELFGLRFHDVGAEEAFWVYDHAPVTIMRRTQELPWEAFRRRLCPQRIPPACA